MARARLEAQLQSELAAAAVAQVAVIREVYEDRIRDLKEAHEQTREADRTTIRALAEQVEYLRVLLGRGQPTQLNLPAPPPRQPSTPLHVSEEEEDVREAHELGFISDQELRNELAKLGIEIESE